MNLRTFTLMMVLRGAKIDTLIHYLAKHYGSTLSKVTKLLKDIQDGQQVCSEYHEQSQTKTSVTLMSNLVWPNLLYSATLLKEIKLHSDLMSSSSLFAEHYTNKFKHRQIFYLPLFGQVEVQESINGLSRTITVNPLQASILLNFNNSSNCSLKALSEGHSTTPDMIKMCISPLIPEIMT